MFMRQEIEAWINENPEVEEWLGSVTLPTAKNYALRFKAFHDWLTAAGGFKGYTPSQILDFQDRATGRARVKIANRLGVFCKELGGELRPATVRGYYMAVRSFFAYHGCALSKRGFSLPDNHKEPTPQLLNRDGLIKIIAAAKLRDKAIYTIAFQGAMGWREFDQFNRAWDQIAPQFEGGAEHIIVKLTARKRRRGLTNGFFTIVGRDGVALLREYLKVRGSPASGEPIFIRTHGGKGDDPAIAARTYRKNLETLARRVGLIKQGDDRHGYGPHQVRDVFRTQWQLTAADGDVAEFMMGHQVDPNKYLKFSKVPSYCVEEYKKAEGRLSLVSIPDPGLVSADEVAALKGRVAELEKLKIDDVIPRVERQYELQIAKVMKENKQLSEMLKEILQRMFKFEDELLFMKYKIHLEEDKAENEEERQRRT